MNQDATGCDEPPAWLIDPDASGFEKTTDRDNPRGYKGYVSVLCAKHHTIYIYRYPLRYSLAGLKQAIQHCLYEAGQLEQLCK